MVINFIRSVMYKNGLLVIFYTENISKHQAKRKKRALRKFEDLTVFLRL